MYFSLPCNSTQSPQLAELSRQSRRRFVLTECKLSPKFCQFRNGVDERLYFVIIIIKCIPLCSNIKQLNNTFHINFLSLI